MILFKQSSMKRKLEIIFMREIFPKINFIIKIQNQFIVSTFLELITWKILSHFSKKNLKFSSIKHWKNQHHHHHHCSLHYRHIYSICQFEFFFFLLLFLLLTFFKIILLVFPFAISVLLAAFLFHSCVFCSDILMQNGMIEIPHRDLWLKYIT